MRPVPTDFYPRSPCGERPEDRSEFIASFDDFYPRSPCGERRRLHGHRHRSSTISIHALLAESDSGPHAWTAQTPPFLSTLSLRRATPPRRICGESYPISIHALLAESDQIFGGQRVGHGQFLSTLSLRRATDHCTHLFNCFTNFYPRSPCGERPAGSLMRVAYFHFYPRSPCGERQHSIVWLCSWTLISIHALLAESDRRSRWSPAGRLQVFLSTLSLRRATADTAENILAYLIFLSTLSLRRATPRSRFAGTGRPYFYPRSPCGERHYDG